MPAIREISIEGFRSIAAIKRLKLRPINVLIGANGSGKSNFLGALDLFRIAATTSYKMSDYVSRSGGADRLLHFGSKKTSNIKFGLALGEEFDNHFADYSIEMHQGFDDRLFCSVTQKAATLPPHLAGTEEVPFTNEPPVEYLRTQLDGWRLYHFYDTGPTSPMKKTADVHDNRRLRADGSNLAAFLFLLHEKHGNAYTQIRRTVRLAAPFFDDFALKPTALNEEKILLEWRHRRSDAYFSSSSLSDGSLRFIALATLLLQPKSLLPSVILLDEPELGLHPYAITLLASLLKQAAATSQIIVATQSPLLLDHFEPEDVLVADRVNGATTLRRLESEKLTAWLEDYSLGQLWEKNEFGGRPAPESKGPESAR